MSLVPARRFAIALAALALSGCVQPPAPEVEPAPSASPAPPAPAPTDDVATFQFAFTNLPGGVACVRGTVTTPAQDRFVRTFAIISTQSPLFDFEGLPPGRSSLFVEAFDVTCANLTTTTPATWVSQEATALDLRPGVQFGYFITMRRAARAEAIVEFEDANPLIFYTVPSFESPPTLVGVPLESVAGTLLNSSTAPFTPTFSIIAATPDHTPGEFVLGTTCRPGETCCQSGQTLPPNGDCILRVVYKPTFIGRHKAVLAAGSNVFLPLRGTPATTNDVSLVPATLDLGAVPASADSLHTFTLTNGSSLPFPSRVKMGGALEFNVVGGSCGTLPRLEPGAQCTVLVRFAPSALGQKVGTLMAGGAGTAGITATVSATVVAPPMVTISPPSRDFGAVVPKQSAETTFTVFNPGATAIALSRSIEGVNHTDFALAGGTCSTLLASNVSCTVIVRFTPATTGTKSADLAVGPGIPFIPLSGRGDGVTISPDVFNYGSVAVGQSATTTLTVTNPTASAVNIAPSRGGLTPDDFSVAGGTCGSMLAAQSSCTIQFRFAPALTGMKQTVLVLGPSVAAATLTGTGVSAGTVTPGTKEYGSVSVGQSADATFQVTNLSNTPLTLAPSTGGINPADFKAVAGGTCGSSLPVMGSCTVVVRFAPTSAGAKSALLSVGNGISGAMLTGTGTGSAPVTPGFTNLVVNDSAASNAGTDLVPNNQQWSVQAMFNSTPGQKAFGDRNVTIDPMSSPVLNGKPWIRTAAGSKNFEGSPLATVTVTGQFLNILLDDRWLAADKRPDWLTQFTDTGLNVVIADGTKKWPYSIWRKPIVSGSTIELPALGDTIAPCYLVVVE
jgi:hypothetical protein